MSLLTLADLKTEIKQGLGGRADLDTRMNNIVDLAQLRLARLKDFDELRQIESTTTPITSVAADDKIITFPTLTDARIRKIYSLRRFAPNDETLAGKLTKVLTRRWDEVIPEPEFWARGWPTHYTVWENNKFELWKVPDIVYTLQIRLSRWPKKASVTGEGNPIDLENVDDLIINLSLSYAYWSLGRTDKAKDFFGIYRGLAKDALMEDAESIDEAMAGVKFPQDISQGSRGYDDPFVRSTVAGDWPL
jgi:hypothetical protein